MAPTRRDTRSRTSSPYSGRPETRSRKAVESGNAPATPKGKQQQEPSSRHRYGLRSMLSNLIWGSPVKRVDEEQSESGDEVNSNAGDDDNEGDDAGFPPLPQKQQQQEAQVISDDEDEEPQSQPSTASTFESAPHHRFTAAEKGKGSSKRADSYSTTRYLPQTSSSAFGGGLRSSATFGDMRSIQRDTGIPASSTPNTSIAREDDNLPSPGDVNAQLANFFAAKGTASLTAEERRKISEILLSGSASAASSNSHNVPTALTPNFSFSVPLPSASTSNVSILSPAYKGLSRSNTTSGGLSAMASRVTGGLTGSQSLSSLSSLANGSGGPTSAAANPRSALNRRQARPLYLGAGYSSQAIARRNRVQAQMGGLYSNLTSFDSAATPAGPSAAGTPAKRRRVGEEADTSMSVPAVAGSSSNAYDLANAPPTFSIESTTPLMSTPGPSRTTQQSALFQSAPHLKAQFAATPAKPSPLRQAAAVATPSPPAKVAEPSPPKTISKTAGLMRGIVGDTSEPRAKAKQAATSSASASNASVASPPITMTRTSKPTTRVPREELVKHAEPPSAVEILERSMPPELRSTSNGKQARPKPPPVPGSARKTRAAAAAAEADTTNDEGKKTREQAKENLRVPPARKSKSRSKTPEVTPAPSPAPSSKSSASTATKLTAGQTAAGEEPKQPSVSTSEDIEMEPTPGPSKPAAFSFGSGAPPTPAPSFFGASGSKSAAPAAIEQPAPPSKGLFAFSPPSNATFTTAGPSAPSSSTSVTLTAGKDESSAIKEPAFKATETTSAAFTVSSTPFDPKHEALKVPSVTLPAFTLYDTQFSFSQATSASDDDAGLKAIKQTVSEMPRNELVVFELL